MVTEASGPDRGSMEAISLDPSSCSDVPVRHFPPGRRPITPEQILKSFNTRAFKREQPDSRDLMLRTISQAVARQEPISFMLYWGKGLRPVLATPELVCLNYLASMIARVAGSYVHGAHVSLVFTDTHAALNGHSQASIRSYFEDLTLAARRHQFDTSLLSTLIDATNLRPEEGLDQRLPPDDMLTELLGSAAKWFRGKGTPRDGAIRYFQANMLERKVIEKAFPRSIFITFNGSQLRSLFPDSLPIFYMYSLRHGVSDKPWFLPPDYDGSRKPAEEARVLLEQTA